VQAKLHLVGDVAQVTATAGGAAIVHLEVLDDPVAVHLDRLGVLPADVEHGAGALVHQVGTQAVAEDLGADVLLGERQAHPAITGADHVDLLQGQGEGLPHSSRDLGAVEALRAPLARMVSRAARNFLSMAPLGGRFSTSMIALS
jgi:hypothetical protein